MSSRTSFTVWHWVVPGTQTSTCTHALFGYPATIVHCAPSMLSAMTLGTACVPPTVEPPPPDAAGRQREQGQRADRGLP